MDNAIPSDVWSTPESLPKQKHTTPVTQEPELFIKGATQKGKDIATKELNIPYTYYTKVYVM